MAAAIGRVQGQAGTLGSQIQGLRRDSQQLIADLQRVDSQARAAADTLLNYRRTVESGRTLPESGWKDTVQLKDFILHRTAAAGAPDVGRAFVSQFERELGGGAQRAAAAPAAAGPRIHRPTPVAAPRTDQGPRPLTPAERADYLGRGYTEDQLDRAVLLKSGTLMVRPPRRAAAPDDDAAPEIPTSPVAPPRGRRQPAAAAADDADAARASDGRQRQLERHDDALFRTEQRKRYHILTERQLRYEWDQTTRSLRQQERELDSTERVYRRLSSFRSKNMTLSAREAFALDSELPGRLADLRGGVRPLRLQRGLLEEEARARGHEVLGDRLYIAGQGRGPGLGRSFLGGLGGGFGGGSGSLIGGVGTFLAGTMTPAGIAAAMGLAVGAFGARSASTYEDTQRQVFGTGMRLGNFSGLRSTAMGQLRGPLRLQFSESMGAIMALAMQTGRTDAGSVAALARAYGLPVEATAQLIGQMGAMGMMPGREVERRVTHDVPNPEYSQAEVARRNAYLAGSHAYLPGEGDGSPLDTRRQREARQRRLSEVGELRRRLAMATDPAARAYLQQQLHARGAMLEADVMPLPPRTIRQAGTERVSVGRGLPEMLAGAYRASPYRQNNALMSAFMEQAGHLMQIQGAGGAPIADFERMPAMLAAATQAFGSDVNPVFGARVAGGLAQGITQPKGDVLRGVALRSIMQMARQMSPEQLAAFQNDPRIRQMTGGVGIDLRSYTGATAAMQNAFALPREQGQQVLRAIAGSYRGLVGSGTEASRMFFTNQFFGGKAALGIAGESLFERLLSAEGGRGGEDLVGQFKELMDKAGSEKAPFELDARMADVETTVGAPLKQLGQGISTAVLDFADQIREAHRAWESGVPMTPAAGSSGGFDQ